MFDLKFTSEAKAQYQDLKLNPSKSPTQAQVFKALGFLQNNPRHPSLHTHEYDAIPHPWNAKQKVWEAYAQNKTHEAYRIFWCYGPERKQITIIAITSHP